jgi:hypothetical protein
MDVTSVCVEKVQGQCWEGEWVTRMEELRVAEVYFGLPLLWDMMLHHWAMGAQHFETG